MLYQNTMSRFSSWYGGVGKEEAKYWHHRAYGGIGEITRMQPQEIGAAAAYEAYRQIKYGSSMYQFLYSNYEQQREALRGLAIAEVVRLWQDTGRMFDQYGQQVACDAAAATADHIISQRELDDGQGFGLGFGTGSYRDRRSSFSAYPMSGYAGSMGGSMGGSVYGGSSPIMGPSAIPIPGSPYSGMGGMGGGIPYANSVGIGMPMSYGGYAGSYGTPGYDVGGLQVAGMGGHPLGGYASFPGTPATVILPPPEDHHRRRSHRHHRHHRRHRSHDRY